MSKRSSNNGWMMTLSRPKSRRLSTSDAFFVAYQEHAGILMQLGIEADLAGSLQREDLENMVAGVVQRWPHLGQTLGRKSLGLNWAGVTRPDDMLRVAQGRESTANWRNQAIDPFREPPFQVLWIPNGGSGTVAFRAHHAALDGESFFAVCSEAVRFLAERTAKHESHFDDPIPVTRLSNLISRKQLRARRLIAMWRYVHRLGEEAKAQRSTRLAMEKCAPGETFTAERALDSDVFIQLKQRAAAIGSAPLWLCAAAWMKAIYAWNTSRGEALNSLVSLEVPVSLRRSRKRVLDSVGNFISPLVLFGDANQSLKNLAGDLRRQVMKAMRAQSHLGTPLFTAPAGFLPWSLFKRLAVNPRTTGFATSHFTWFEHESDIRAEIANLSEGALRVIAQRIYTPVCLHMGAALAVVAWPDQAQLFLTYRGTALSNSSAEHLIDLVVDELVNDRY